MLALPKKGNKNTLDAGIEGRRKPLLTEHSHLFHTYLQPELLELR